jgi:hypothetical protein
MSISVDPAKASPGEITFRVIYPPLSNENDMTVHEVTFALTELEEAKETYGNNGVFSKIFNQIDNARKNWYPLTNRFQLLDVHIEDTKELERAKILKNEIANAPLVKHYNLDIQPEV